VPGGINEPPAPPLPKSLCIAYNLVCSKLYAESDGDLGRTGRIILVRHGETDGNRGTRRWLGWTDLSLNAHGVDQAEAVADALSGEHIAAIYSSDLRRSVETAERIASRHSLPVCEQSAFREVNYGEWEGLSEEECRSRDPELLLKRESDPENTCPPGGESYREMMERFVPAVNEIRRKHANASAVLVTHHGNVRVLLCDVMQIPRSCYRSFGILNCSVTELVVLGDAFVVNRINGVAHLSIEE